MSTDCIFEWLQNLEACVYVAGEQTAQLHDCLNAPRSSHHM